MDFRTELAKWGYNKGNSIDVEILVNEILPSLFSQQKRSYSEEEAGELVYNIIGEYAKEYGITIDGAKLNDLFNQLKKTII
jgi:hypothetical protein